MHRPTANRVDPGQIRSAPDAPAPSTWSRIREHKVLQWTLAYLGGALAVAHAQELIAHAFGWPEWTGRVTLGALAACLPLIVALAWYHGHKALTRVGEGELLVVSLLALIGAGMLVALVRVPERAAPTRAAPALTGEPARALVAARSIAVLPFADMSAARDQEYFADGMADEILELLSRLPGLRVVGRTSSFQFKGQSQDLRAMGARLGVAYLVEGSVRRSGERVRVTTQLVDAGPGTRIWSGSYERALGDVLQLQEQIALQIAHTLNITVDAIESSRGVQTLPDPEAYTLLLRARWAEDRGSSGLQQAEEDLSRALQRDPHFVRAAEELAVVAAIRTVLSYVPANDGLRLVEQRARRVLDLNGSSATAHALLGCVHAQRFEWDAARLELARAQQLGPLNRAARLCQVSLAWFRGDIREALRIGEMQLTDDPLDPGTHGDHAYSLYFSGEPEAARRMIQEGLAIAPTLPTAHYLLGQIHLSRGENAQALEEMMAEPDPDARLAGRAMALHRLHRELESAAALEQLIRSSASDWAYGVAEAQAFCGHRELALQWLARAYEQHDGDLRLIRFDPLLDSIRPDPRFRELLQRMHLQ